MGGGCGTCGRQERCIQGFVGEIGGKEITWKIRHRWAGDIKNDLKDEGTRSRGLDWSSSGYGKVVGCFECCNEPSGFIKCGAWGFLTSWGQGNLSGRDLFHGVSCFKDFIVHQSDHLVASWLALKLCYLRLFTWLLMRVSLLRCDTASFSGRL